MNQDGIHTIESNPMKTLSMIVLFLWVCLCSWSDVAIAQNSSFDLKELERSRVLSAAEKYVKEDPITITASSSPRSAGGLHDYFSESDYWWPDPKNPNGPYIRRDGMTNPGNFDEHRQAMRRLSLHVPALAAAYKLTGDERFAACAVHHLKAWFVDEHTKMNPHLMYAQAVKGVATGRGTGIIDTIHLIEVARAMLILESSRSMTPSDRVAIKRWFTDYMEWMTTHKNGLQEREAKNNHGTTWVMQVAAFAQLVGDSAKLQYCRNRFREVLLPDQMAVDGSFPLELARTKPYGYSLFNLDAMATVCQLLSTPTDNLWEFTLPDGRNMRRGMEFMYPFIADKTKWPHPNDVMFFEFWPVRQPALLFAGTAYNNSKYIDVWKKLDPDPTNDEVLRNLPVRQPLLWID
jgi:hypothetical protein